MEESSKKSKKPKSATNSRLSKLMPDEIMLEIITRLPMKQIVRAKLVSKRWMHVLSSKSFKKFFLEKMKQQNARSFIYKERVINPPLLYKLSSDDVPTVTRVVEDGDEELEVLGSVNGLMVYCTLEDEFFLWNPSTDMSVRIPPEPISFHSGFLECTVYGGLGHTPDDDDYKFVRIACFSNNDDFKSEVKMYSRNNNIWTSLPDFPFQTNPYNKAVWAGGNLHWSIYTGNGQFAVAYFNIRNQTYGLIEPPQGFEISQMGAIEDLDDDSIAIYSNSVRWLNGGRRRCTFKMFVLTYSGVRKLWSKLTLQKDGQMHQPFELLPISFVEHGRNNILFREQPGGSFFTINLIENTSSDGVPDLDAPNAFVNAFKYVFSFESPSVS